MTASIATARETRPMKATQTHSAPAFITATPHISNISIGRRILYAHSNRRRSVNRVKRRPAQASLLSELMVKGVEVALASAATQVVQQQQQEKAARERAEQQRQEEEAEANKRRWFWQRRGDNATDNDRGGTDSGVFDNDDTGRTQTWTRTERRIADESRGSWATADRVAKLADEIAPQVVRAQNELRGMLARRGDNAKWTKLAICVAVDLVGSGGLGIPFVADFLDVVTAPVCAAVVQTLFGSPVATVATFSEEILPGTDGIPSATLAWFAERSGYIESPERENYP